jgi:DNA helicase HerA-like ATPase
MTADKLVQDAVLRVGEVCGVDGRRVYVRVDKNKNLTDLFLDGDILKNISVNSFIEIRKGFLSLIGRVEGEEIEEERPPSPAKQFSTANRSKRTLTVALSGYIDEKGRFTGGTKELPLIGNEAYVVTREKIALVHNLATDGAPSISIADIYGDNLAIEFPIDGLFNSHIAIFGNTGSGKSNTLAYLYQELIRALQARNKEAFEANARFVLFDFNGEYTAPHCISPDKKVYNLSTRLGEADRLPMKQDALLDIEVLSILSDATEKTQKPFLRRAVRLYQRVIGPDVGDPVAYLKGILRSLVKDTLIMSDKARASQVIEYFREVLPALDAHGNVVELSGDLDWNNKHSEFMLTPEGVYLRSHPNRIPDAVLYKHIDSFDLDESLLSNVVTFLYIQLISDVIANRSQSDHIAPVVNRLKAKQSDVDKIFELDAQGDFWASNFVVVNLARVNLDMRKTLPLLLAKRLYTEHKDRGPGQSLSIIIDEAHNILSTESFREAESWKDYRLETFEEIIKEGRKFGVFVTIASQRPNDISQTITSQAHNYFIHRLINERDLTAISSAVSYIDKVTEESIPTLPTGTCVFSGVASNMPLKINVRELEEMKKPKSDTRRLTVVVPAV